MSSTWGNLINISVFGESHGNGIGVVINGLPAGYEINIDDIKTQMARRAPGTGSYATPRKEADEPNILSGLCNGFTTGAPLACVIYNTNTQSEDYKNVLQTPRPSHADFSGFVRYNGFNDIRGGGHFSGRLTAPITFAGAVCRQILEKKGIIIGSHVKSVGEHFDETFNDENLNETLLNKINKELFPVVSWQAREKMLEEIEKARMEQDSIGGVVECAVIGMPAGVGSPMFSGVENKLASIIFGIPAVKGLEFGAGFGFSKMRGSQANDPFYVEDNQVKTKTNNNGGILGGISTGMPILFSTVIKPTASISQEQDSVEVTQMKNVKLVIKGRHDPCIVPRAAIVIESAAAIAIIDLLAEVGKI